MRAGRRVLPIAEGRRGSRRQSPAHLLGGSVMLRAEQFAACMEAAQC